MMHGIIGYACPGERFKGRRKPRQRDLVVWLDRDCLQDLFDHGTNLLDGLSQSVDLCELLLKRLKPLLKRAIVAISSTGGIGIGPKVEVECLKVISKSIR